MICAVLVLGMSNISSLAATKRETASGTYDGRLWTGITSYETVLGKYTMYLTCDWEDVKFDWTCYIWNDGVYPIKNGEKSGNYVVEQVYYLFDDFPNALSSLPQCQVMNSKRAKK